MDWEWVRRTGQYRKLKIAYVLSAIISLVVVGFMAYLFITGNVTDDSLLCLIVSLFIAGPTVFYLQFFSIKCPKCGVFPALKMQLHRKKKSIPTISTWTTCWFCENYGIVEKKNAYSILRWIIIAIAIGLALFLATYYIL